jgi:hypothetical protein
VGDVDKLGEVDGKSRQVLEASGSCVALHSCAAQANLLLDPLDLLQEIENLLFCLNCSRFLGYPSMLYCLSQLLLESQEIRKIIGLPILSHYQFD